MQNFWSYWIVGLTLTNIVGVVFLLFWTSKQSPENVLDHESCGHSYDGIEELNQPLPKWWLNLFFLTIIFALIYLAFFPGLGAYKGILNWSAEKQWTNEVEQADNHYAAIYAQYAKMPIEELQGYEEPLKVGQRLFANNCAICHGQDAKGATGFPNLTDKDWLYGGDTQSIKTSIVQGRSGMMPAFGQSLGQEKVHAVAAYLLKLNGRETENHLAEIGEQTFKNTCAACHGIDAKGNQMFGAPNLTDNVWLYGGSVAAIKETISKGRQGKMPAHKALLSDDKIHVIAAYVYSLSHPKK